MRFKTSQDFGIDSLLVDFVEFIFTTQGKVARNKFCKDSLNKIRTFFWKVLSTFNNCKFWYRICLVLGKCNRKFLITVSNVSKSKRKFKTVCGNNRKLKKASSWSPWKKTDYEVLLSIHEFYWVYLSSSTTITARITFT